MRRLLFVISVCVCCVTLFGVDNQARNKRQAPQQKAGQPDKPNMAGGTFVQQVSGEAVYQTHCARCHEVVSPRVPHREALEQMSASRILRSLDFGSMMTISYTLRRNEREAVAAYLGKAREEAAPLQKAYCADRRVRLAGRAPRQQWNGWSPTAANTRFQPGEVSHLTVEQAQNLKLKWAFGYEGDVTAFAQPTILGGNLFVGSAGGVVHALSAETGCVRWVFQANGPVRSAILAVPSGNRYSLLFGDQNGWFYSLNAETGRLRWKRKIENHEATRLTGAPVAYRDMVFIPVASWEETRATNPDYQCCTFRGSIVALRVRDGSLVWKAYTVGESKETGSSKVGTPQWGPSGAGIWSAPTLDPERNLIYVTTGNNYSFPATDTSDAVLAFHLATGRMVWAKQLRPGDAFNSSCGRGGPNCPKERGPDYDFGSSAMLVRLADGRSLLVAGQKSGMVYALDPNQKGAIVWQSRVGRGGGIGGVQWGMATDGQQVYAAVSDVVVMPKMNRDPFDARPFNLSPMAGGGLTALRLNDGSKAWYAAAPSTCDSKPGCSPAQSAAVTAIPGAVFSGSLDGHLRAFAAEDGRLLWDFDTARDYETVNGVKGRGGSLDGPGVVVVGGMVFVNSGYARFGAMPGNVLLAFAPDNSPGERR